MKPLARVLIEPVPKSFTRGTHRVASPEDTLAKVTPLAGRMGITRIGNVTGLDHIGIPVAIAVRPLSRSVCVSQGKGLTLAQAKVSALMEASELFHGEKLAARIRVASLRDMGRDGCIADVEALCTVKPLSRGAFIPWIEGCDLLRDSTCWMPAELVHTEYDASETPGEGYFLAGTNGLASGNRPAEALVAALCELIERDAVAVWEARGLTSRAACRLDPATVADEACLDLLDRYERADIAVRLFDVTSDLGVAVFVCDIRSRVNDPSSIARRFRGAGCHPCRAVALSRALTEAAQVRLTHIVGIRDDIFPDAYEETLAQRSGAALLDALAVSLPPRSFRDVPSFESDDIVADIRFLLERLGAGGLAQAIAVDLTRPELGIPVVRVVVPGLEWDCSHPDYRPGPRARRAAEEG